jgi:hypothetical protein
MSPRFMGGARLGSLIEKGLCVQINSWRRDRFFQEIFRKAIPPEFYQDALFWSWIS